MPEFEGNAPDFMDRYMRERLVELAFEDHRFGMSDAEKRNEFFAAIKTAKLTKSSDGIILTRGQRNRGWDDKYYLFPIPFTEIQKTINSCRIRVGKTTMI